MWPSFLFGLYNFFDGMRFGSAMKNELDLRTMSEEEVMMLFYDASCIVTSDRWKACWMVAIACLESGYGQHYIDHNVVGYHYVDGMGWEYVTAKEGMTGKQRKYRKFNSFADCFKSLLYLLDKSQATKEYVASRKIDTSTISGRKKRIRKFSEGYCPMDKSHADKVYSIYVRVIALVNQIYGDETIIA